MKKQIIVMVMGIASLGLVSSMAAAKSGNVTAIEGSYSLTKSCKKGYVKTSKGKCIKLVCPAGTYMNSAKTKCLPKRTMPGGSPKGFGH